MKWIDKFGGWALLACAIALAVFWIAHSRDLPSCTATADQPLRLTLERSMRKQP